MNTKTIRLQALLTQKEFSEEIGVSLSAICKWENGERSPSLKQQRKIICFCKKYNINIKE